MPTECEIIFKWKSVFCLGTDSYLKKIHIFSACLKNNKKLGRQRGVNMYLENTVIIYSSLIYKELEQLIHWKKTPHKLRQICKLIKEMQYVLTSRPNI